MASTVQRSLMAKAQRANPYAKMAETALGHMEHIRNCIDQQVTEQRQVQAIRRQADCTFIGADQDPTVTYPQAGTYAVFRVPNNMSWKCMRVAVASSANDILYMYRGTPQPQNIVERMECKADGFFVDSFSNDLYMAGGTLIIVQSSLAANAFHVNIEIERMVPYMEPVSSHELHDELMQTPHDNTGADHDYASVDIVEPQVERHMDAAIEAPDEQPDSSAIQHAERQLLPDPNLHLPAAHT
jgi:hypothetical protein